MTRNNRPNRHCSVVAVGERGVLIEGASGAGKTSLALGLIDVARGRGLNAALVSDDQALLEVRGGRLVASAPAAIAGLAEVRGFGVAGFPFQPECDIALIARLVADGEVPRMAEEEAETLMGVAVPLVRLPERHEQQSVRILLAWLESRAETAAQS